MTFFQLPFGVCFPCNALWFSVSSVLLLAQENWYIWPSRTRPPQTSSSASTTRGCWLKWACFFTHHSALSTGRLSGNLLLHWKKNNFFVVFLSLHPLLQLNCWHLDRHRFFFYLWYCLQVWFLCKSSDQTSPSGQSGSSLWQSQNAWGERSRCHSRHARRWACQANMELQSNKNHDVLFSTVLLHTCTHTSPTDIC